jgi:hypothetical protein
MRFEIDEQILYRRVGAAISGLGVRMLWLIQIEGSEDVDVSELVN